MAEMVRSLVIDEIFLQFVADMVIYFVSLHKSRHRNMGQLPPGVLWFWPGWCRVSHIVTRATVTYNAPTRNCPTADNVMVNVDLSLTFRIGPDADAAANFIYKLGAHRFDELIGAETEVAIRGLV